MKYEVRVLCVCEKEREKEKENESCACCRDGEDGAKLSDTDEVHGS